MNRFNGGNYWLNIILLEEVLNLLYDFLKPIKYMSFSSENHLRVYITSQQDKFFNNSSNKKYLKFQTYIRLEFLIDIVQENGKYIFKVDAFSLKVI